MRRILSDAGFADIALKPHDLELDIAVGRGLDTAVRAAMTIGPTSRMLEGQSEAVRSPGGGHPQGARRPRARGQRAAWRGDLDRRDESKIKRGYSNASYVRLNARKNACI